jgi:chemotaxis protein methyltransferase CheR
MRLVVERIARSLVPGGFLFLGHTETLRDVSDAFQLRHTHGTFYYQLKGDAAPASLSLPGVTMSSEPLHATISTFDETWVETIRSATERVAALVPPVLAGSSPRLKIAWDASPALDLLRKERFTDALEKLHDRPQESKHDPDTLLLEAVLLVQSGQLAVAEIACQRLIATDELNAGAHYLLALCREHCGDPDGAGESDRTAARLDPAFAMPRLHLGLLARHVRDSETAAHELGHALILLKREEASRILLFGGGFSREALIALCQSARRRCEDRLRVRAT